MKLASSPGTASASRSPTRPSRCSTPSCPAWRPTTTWATLYNRTGEILPDSVLAELRGHDAILLGAIGDPSVPPGVLERGLLLRLRFELDQYVNLRPTKLYPGVETPLAGSPEIDFIVYREGTEGPYVGNGGALRKGTPNEIATEVSINTAFGVERVVRAAFERANSRPRKHLTLVHKNNVLVYAGDLWFRTVQAVGAEYPRSRSPTTTSMRR